MESIFNEGYSIDRPLLLNGTNYTFWKTRMKIFIQTQDYDLQKIIENGSHTHDASIEHDKELSQLNAKTMNILYCSLDLNKFNLISSYISAKEV